MSTGYATLTGSQVEYILRMPAYEMPRGANPERALFDHIRFTSGFETGRLTGEECHDDPATASFVCAANYEFSSPVEKLGVDCTFYEVTVPNHIHMLHAERAGKQDQAILDSSFPSATLAFRPPTAFETVVDQSASGAFRVWSSSVQLLLLVAIAIAARNGGELALLTVAFLGGECIGTLAVLRSTWQPSPRFAEAAAALALAYLALEILAFPQSRGRWALSLIFGTFGGMYFATFINESGYRSLYVLGGAAAAGTSVTLLAAAARLPIPHRYRRAFSIVAASALLVTGSVWFLVRLHG